MPQTTRTEACGVTGRLTIIEVPGKPAHSSANKPMPIILHKESQTSPALCAPLRRYCYLALLLLPPLLLHIRRGALAGREALFSTVSIYPTVLHKEQQATSSSRPPLGRHCYLGPLLLQPPLLHVQGAYKLKGCPHLACTCGGARLKAEHAAGCRGVCIWQE